MNSNKIILTSMALAIASVAALPFVTTASERGERLTGEARIIRVPEGTEMTGEIEKAIQLIEGKLITPVSLYQNRTARMSRARVRDSVQYEFALTDTSDSLISFDVYQSHLRGTWTKIASGVCHPGMESVKVAMPETGVMVEPAKHPRFAFAFALRSPAFQRPS